MRASLLAIVCALVAGCYDAAHELCKVSCTADSDCAALDGYGPAATCDQLRCTLPGTSCLVGSATDGGVVDVVDGVAPDAFVPSGPDVTAVSAGGGFACAIDGSGQLSCWGADLEGVVPPGSDGLVLPSVAVATPVVVASPSGSAWDSVTTGERHACGMSGGTLYCWGDNTLYQCGNDNGPLTWPPQAVPMEANLPWTKVVAGALHTCALTGSDIYCWGDDESSQFGTNGGFIGGTSIPTAPDGSLVWKDVWAGRGITCGLTVDDEPYCWGGPTGDRIGSGSPGSSAEPARVKWGAAAPLAKLAIGDEAVCGISTTGELWCWGDGSHGAVGAGSAYATPATNPDVPALVGSGHVWDDVATGGSVTCAVSAGQVWCWGTGASGSLGTGVWSQTVDHPEPVVTTLSPGAHVAVGGYLEFNFKDPVSYDFSAPVDFACATFEQKLSCWGDNGYGELGDGVASRALAPVPVTLPMGTATDLVMGDHHACVTIDGDVACWGATLHAEADGATISGDSAAPCQPSGRCDLPVATLLSPPAAPAGSLVTGADFTCALEASSVVECWGDGAASQLVGSAGGTRASTTMAGTTGLLATTEQACALRDNAAQPDTPPVCWGATELGPAHGPKLVPGYGSAAGLAFNAKTGGVLRTDGFADWMGDNTFGQFGDLTTDGTTPPQYASGNPDVFSQIALSSDTSAAFACGMRSDTQELDCWGDNSIGQVPIMSEVIQSSYDSPQAITYDDCTALAVGGRHACAVCGGNIACWGGNTRGQVGNGFTQPGAGITAIAAASSNDPWMQVAAGSDTTCALAQSGAVACWGDGLHGELGNGGAGTPLPGERWVGL